jgi:hypothetical protein
VYNGREKVAASDFWTTEAPASKAPFYYDGITRDEFFVEQYYFLYYTAKLAPKLKAYKTLRRQLEDGDILGIPDGFKALCPDPNNCMAFLDLINVA